MPFTAGLPTIQAVAGLWSTGADLVRLGTGWSSLLPPALARDALTTRAGSSAGGRRVGPGWLLPPGGQTAVHAGLGLESAAILRIRVRDGRTHVALTSRRVMIESVDGRLLHSWMNRSER